MYSTTRMKVFWMSVDGGKGVGMVQIVVDVLSKYNIYILPFHATHHDFRFHILITLYIHKHIVGISFLLRIINFGRFFIFTSCHFRFHLFIICIN